MAINKEWIEKLEANFQEVIQCIEAQTRSTDSGMQNLDNSFREMMDRLSQIDGGQGWTRLGLPTIAQDGNCLRKLFRVVREPRQS
jgi:hypothetical protein